jgi:hypothetical protein
MFLTKVVCGIGMCLKGISVLAKAEGTRAAK